MDAEKVPFQRLYLLLKFGPWFSFICSGHAWLFFSFYDLVWYGLDRYAWFCLVRFSLRISVARVGLTLLFLCLVWLGWFGLARLGVVWYGF